MKSICFSRKDVFATRLGVKTMMIIPLRHCPPKNHLKDFKKVIIPGAVEFYFKGRKETWEMQYCEGDIVNVKEEWAFVVENGKQKYFFKQCI